MTLKDLDEVIATVKSQLRYHRTNQQNRAQIEHNLEAKRRTVAKLQREIAAEEQSLEDGPDLIVQLLARLEELNKKRIHEANREKIAKLLELHGKLEEAAS